MRRVLVSCLLVLGACTGAQEIVTTSSISTTTSIAPSSTSSAPPSTTTAPATSTGVGPLQSLAYEEVAQMPFPVQVVARPGDQSSYVITRDGRVWVLLDGEVRSEPVLDVTARVGDSSLEQGLLSIALHPTDPARLYLHYSDESGDTVVSEFTFLSPTVIDPGSERVLLQVAQPARNHNGGMLQFTPDGTLLLGLGDGGGADDQFGNGQNPDTLLAGLVAIDVDGDPNPTKYATGLRNPWRFWIDGDLIYVADVGQDLFEEVDVVPLQPGYNFGWSIAEGLHCFNSPAGCDTSGQVIPVIEIRHEEAGTCSITGGVIYRGTAIPELDGAYLYSDYCGGWLRSFVYDGGAAVDQTDWTEQVGVPGLVTGFGVDGAGEVYVTTEQGLFALVAVR